MKKESRNFKSSGLIVDVLEYAFIEWLVRKNVFLAFKTNYGSAVLPGQTFRDALRAHIRRSLRNPHLGLTHLISSAFLFSSTPEGYNFWRKYSVAWERFCFKLQSKS